MQTALVRSVPGEERLQISLKYSLPLGPNVKEHVFNFDRMQSEELQRSLQRITANITNVIKKKTKKKKKKANNGNEGGAASVDQEEEPQLPVCMIDTVSGDAIKEFIPNHEAWAERNQLQIGEATYTIQINTPTVLKMSLPSVIMADFQVYPKLDIEFADLNKCRFDWFVEKDTDIIEKTDDHESVASAPKKAKTGDEPDWTKVHEGLFFTPGQEHVGRRIKLVCKPSDGKRDGEEFSTKNGMTVSAGPGHCPFMDRHKHTKEPSANGW